MKYSAVKGFIEALKKWNEITKENKAADFQTLIFRIHSKIGIKDNSILIEGTEDRLLKSLEDRINYLTHSEKINEIFLISSLVNHVTKIFKHSIETHGDSILLNETIIKDQGLEKFQHVLEKVKASDYFIKLKNDYYRWIEIVSLDLSDERFENWERDLLIERGKLSEEHSKEMSDKYGDMTMKEILEKE